MSDSILLIGGNLGNRLLTIEKTVKRIQECIGEILASSSIVESEPWGFNDENNFLNQVLIVRTSFTPGNLLIQLNNIEREMGRIVKSDIYSSRTMDIDILFYDDEVIETESLIIPHPRLHLRRFTLLPLNEIAPEMIHPKLGKSVSRLLEECNDKSQVSIFNK